MKIYILTGKFGMGHYNAAKAIKQQTENNLPCDTVEIIDWMNYVSPKLADRYYAFFSLMVNKGYRIYNKRYQLLENKKTSQRPDLYLYFSWKFSRFIKSKKPDLIISTLPICSQIVSRYNEKKGSNIRLITCVTDITGHSEWINKHTELYMVGSRSVKDKFLAKGVRPSQIFETGIPVRAEFYKEIVEEAGNNTVRKILIMGGGLGIMTEDDSFYSGLDQLKNVDVTIITGKNKKLYDRLSRRYSHLKILGFVDNVQDYMKGADLVVTKPGGVTTFEAIHAGVPILAWNPLLQQEIYNAEYIHDMGIGTVYNGDSKECLEYILSVLEDGTLNSYRYHIQMLNKSMKDKNIITVVNYINETRFFSKTLSYGFENPHERQVERLNEKISSYI